MLERKRSFTIETRKRKTKTKRVPENNASVGHQEDERRQQRN